MLYPPLTPQRANQSFGTTRSATSAAGVTDTPEGDLGASSGQPPNGSGVGEFSLVSELVDFMSSFERLDFPPDTGALILRRLAFLTGLAGRQSATTKTAQQMFHILQRIMCHRRDPSLVRVVLVSMMDMTLDPSAPSLVSMSSAPLPTGHTGSVLSSTESVTFTALPEGTDIFSSPSYFFEFCGGLNSALILPRIDKWPFVKAYHFSAWIKWSPDEQGISPTDLGLPIDHSALTSTVCDMLTAHLQENTTGGKKPRTPRNTNDPEAVSVSHRYIYSFMTAKAHGMELLVHKHDGHLQVNVHGRSVTQLATGARLEPNTWTYLTLWHAAPRAFGRSMIRIYLNTKLAFDGEVSYPQIIDPLTFSAIGTSTISPSKHSSFRGQIAGIYLFRRPLTEKQDQMLFRKGPDYSLSTLTIEEKQNWLKSVGGFVRKPLGFLFGNQPDGDEEGLDEVFKSSALVLHPKCVEGDTCIDLAPLYADQPPVNTTISSDVRICHAQSVRDAVSWVQGGIAAFFPFLEHVNSAIQSAPSTPSKAEDFGDDIALFFTTLNRMLKYNAQNQLAMLRADGFAIIGHALLPLLSAAFITLQTLAALESLSNHMSWLPSSPPAGNGVPSVTLDMSVYDPELDFRTMCLRLPVSRAAERSLFNDLFIHVISNFSLWFQAEVAFAPKKSLIHLLKSLVTKQPQYFRELLPISQILDCLRLHLPYHDLVKTLNGAQPSLSDGTRPFGQQEIFGLSSSTNMKPQIQKIDHACRHLRETQKLRKEMLEILELLITHGTDMTIQPEDIILLVQVCLEWTDSVQVAEILELLTDLLYSFPNAVYPVLVNGRKANLIILSILQRHAQSPVAQISSLHVLGSLLSFSFGSQEYFKPSTRMKKDGLFVALQDTLMPHPINNDSYHALMEIALSLPPGSIGLAHASQIYIERTCARHSTAGVLAADSRFSDGEIDPKGRRKNMLKRQIVFPEVLEVVLSLGQSKHCSLDVMDILSDIHTLLKASPQNCKRICIELPCWQRILLQLLDWNLTGPTVKPSLLDTSSFCPDSPVDQAWFKLPAWPDALRDAKEFVNRPGNVEPVSDTRKSSELPPTSFPLLSRDSEIARRKSQQGPMEQRMSVFSGFFNKSVETAAETANWIKDAVVDSATNADTFAQDENEGFDGHRSESKDSSVAPGRSSEPDLTGNEQEWTTERMARRVIGDLLAFSLMHLEDGWRQWQDTMMFLRFESDQHDEISEKHFRAVRQDLLSTGLRILARKTLSSGTMNRSKLLLLKDNMMGLIDMMEEVLYLQPCDSDFHVVHRLGDEQRSESISIERASRDNSAPEILADGTDIIVAQVDSASQTKPNITTDGVKAVDEKGPASLTRAHGSKKEFSEMNTAHGKSVNEGGNGKALSDGGEASVNPEVEHSKPCMYDEWKLIENLLITIFELELPLRPVPLVSDQDKPETRLRRGGPLRVVLRLLLDCLDSSCSRLVGTTTPVHTIESVLAALVFVVKLCLGEGASPAQKKAEAPKNDWRNYYTLHVLQRLCSIAYNCPKVARGVFVSAISNIVGHVRPFAIVRGDVFLPSPTYALIIKTQL